MSMLMLDVEDCPLVSYTTVEFTIKLENLLGKKILSTLPLVTWKKILSTLPLLIPYF